jgi:hypothetical protein
VHADLRRAMFAMADADGDGRIRCTWHTTLGRRRPIFFVACRTGSYKSQSDESLPTLDLVQHVP